MYVLFFALCIPVAINAGNVGQVELNSISKFYSVLFCAVKNKVGMCLPP